MIVLIAVFAILSRKECIVWLNTSQPRHLASNMSQPAGGRTRPDRLTRPRGAERAYADGGQTLAYRNSPFTLLFRYPPGDSAVINSS